MASPHLSSQPAHTLPSHSALALHPRFAPHRSWLWGRDGELWRPAGRLSDWSYAGYMAGDKPIPDFSTAVFSVKDYGAKGDGQTGG